MSYTYWIDRDFEAVKTAATYTDLFAVAEQILHRMPRPRAQVCGPITTGGAGSVEANLRRFDRAVTLLEKEGVGVFDQVPFEATMQRLKTLLEGEKYSMKLLEDFYLPIFEKHLVDRLYFLPDWQSSTGARWEHQQASRLGLEIMYLVEV